MWFLLVWIQFMLKKMIFTLPHSSWLYKWESSTMRALQIWTSNAYSALFVMVQKAKTGWRPKNDEICSSKTFSIKYAPVSSNADKKCVHAGGTEVFTVTQGWPTESEYFRLTGLSYQLLQWGWSHPSHQPAVPWVRGRAPSSWRLSTWTQRASRASLS